MILSIIFLIKAGSNLEVVRNNLLVREALPFETRDKLAGYAQEIRKHVRIGPRRRLLHRQRSDGTGPDAQVISVTLDWRVSDEVVEVSVVAEMRRVHHVSIKVDESTEEPERVLLEEFPQTAISELNRYR